MVDVTRLTHCLSCLRSIPFQLLKQEQPERKISFDAVVASVHSNAVNEDVFRGLKAQHSEHLLIILYSWFLENACKSVKFTANLIAKLMRVLR